MEGTYPLPEAQADRFMMKLVVSPPQRDDLVRILDVKPALAMDSVQGTVSTDQLNLFQAHVAELPAANSVRELVADLILATQPTASEGEIQLGASPRAGQALLSVARARAAMSGRLHVTQADVLSMAVPVLRHRIVLSYAGRARGLNVEEFVEALVTRFR